jgi:hypothetical protein
MEIKFKLKTESFKIPLVLKPKLAIQFEPSEENIEITEEEAIQTGLREDIGLTRLGADAGWEIWVEPLNFVLKEGSRYSYYSNFRALLETLLDRRIRFWITQEKWNKLDIALEKAEQDIDKACERVSRNVEFLNKKYGELRIEI